MSEFVDKFTQEAETTTRKMVTEFEQRLLNEKNKADEARQKMLLEKSEIEIKYSKMQKEAEALKQENMGLQLAKSEAMQKQIEMFEQLENTK